MIKVPVVYDPPMCCSTGALAVLLLLSALLSEGCSKQKPTGTITIDGSDTVYPLSKALADAFHQSNPGVKFDTRFSGTGAGFRKFCAGQVDIQGASRPINVAEGEQCKAGHVDYIELAVASDSLTVVVNPQNSFVDCLSLQELKTVWEPAAEGKVNNWQQVRAGFPSRPMTRSSVQGGPRERLTTSRWRSSGPKAAAARTTPRARTTRPSSAALNRIPTRSGTFLMRTTRPTRTSWKLVAVDSGHGCVLPNPRETVVNDTYRPLSRPLMLYVNVAASSRPEVSAFVHQYIDFSSAATVDKVGYVPLPLSSLSAQNTRFDKGVTGSAMGGHGSVLGIMHDWFNVSDEDKIKAQLAQ